MVTEKGEKEAKGGMQEKTQGECFPKAISLENERGLISWVLATSGA